MGETTKTLRIGERFKMAFTVKRDEVKAVEEMLIENKVEYELRRTAFPAFTEIYVKVNIRRAETVRQLLQNSKTQTYND